MNKNFSFFLDLKLTLDIKMRMTVIKKFYGYRGGKESEKETDYQY